MSVIPDRELSDLQQLGRALSNARSARRRNLRRIMGAALGDFVHGVEQIAATDRSVLSYQPRSAGAVYGD